MTRARDERRGRMARPVNVGALRRSLIWMVPVAAGALGVAALVIGAQSAARAGRAGEPYLADAWIALVYPIVGAWLVTSRRRLAAGAVMLSAALLSVTGLSVAWSSFAALDGDTGQAARAAAWLATWAWTPYLLLPTALPLLYVSHRTRPRPARVLLAVTAVAVALTAVLSSVARGSVSEESGVDNPLGIDALAPLTTAGAVLPGLVLLVLAPLVVITLGRDRLRHRGEGTNAALLGAAAFWAAAVTADVFPYPWNDVWTAVGASFLPAAFVVDQYLRGLQEAEQERWRHMVTARDAERGRVRQELHDGLGPRLAGLGLQLEGLQDGAPGELRETIGDVRDELREAVVEVRRIVDGLAPRALEELGLVGAIRACAESVAPGRVDVEAVDVESLEPEVEVTAYRITSEALTNAVRHGDPDRIGVIVSSDGPWLRVIVTDDGTGGAAARADRLGLPGMAARARALGGRLEVVAREPHGTVVQALLPRKGAR